MSLKSWLADKPRMRAAGHYNIILAGGTFVDKAYYQDYWSARNAPARKIVDRKSVV